MTGLWTKMIVHDFDKDGDADIIAGNLGLNTQLRASEKRTPQAGLQRFRQ